MTRALIPTDYSHTRVIGFSVTRSIWDEFRAAISNPSAWELLWYSGGAVDIWADPNSPAWTANGGTLNPAESGGTGGMVNGISHATDPTVGTSTIDRVILNVSGLTTTAADPVVAGYNGGTRPDLGLTAYDTTGFTSTDPNYAYGYVNVTEYWRLYINAAVANIRSKYPNVRMILLQPNIDGVSGGYCADSSTESTTFDVVRSTYTSKYIRSAIAALTRGNVRGGWAGYVANCTDFADWGGHLNTGSPQTTLGQAMAAYYEANL